MKNQRVGDMHEDELIRRYFGPICGDLSDDVGVISLSPDHQLLVSTDALHEGVHFLRESPALLVGQKALRVNLSDIIASGGRPTCFTLSLALPKILETSWVQGFTNGLKKAMDETGVELIGGDTTASMDKIAVSITVFGETPTGKRIQRKTARVGDIVAVTGFLGDASIGLDVVLGSRHFDQIETCLWLDHHFRPPFRYPFMASARNLIHAMMDLSDGLATDLPRLCRASSVGAHIDLDQIPISKSARDLRLRPEDAVSRGEDYELLFTLDPDDWPALVKAAAASKTTVTRVGRVVEAEGVRFYNKGEEIAPAFSSYHHFSP